MNQKSPSPLANPSTILSKDCSHSLSQLKHPKNNIREELSIYIPPTIASTIPILRLIPRNKRVKDLAPAGPFITKKKRTTV